MENVLKQCYFCEGWFPSDQVEEIDLWRHPSGTYAKEYLCKNCIADRASKFSRLVRAASEALDKPENFKEIEISDGDLKVLTRNLNVANVNSTNLTGINQKRRGKDD